MLLALLPPRVAFKYEPLLYQYGSIVLIAVIFVPALIGVERSAAMGLREHRIPGHQADHGLPSL